MPYAEFSAEGLLSHQDFLPNTKPMRASGVIILRVQSDIDGDIE